MFGKIMFYLKPFFGLIFSATGTVLRNTAEEAVAQVEAEGDALSGHIKRQRAAGIIRRELDKAGLAGISAQIIYAAIELALARTRKGSVE